MTAKRTQRNLNSQSSRESFSGKRHRVNGVSQKTPYPFEGTTSKDSTKCGEAALEWLLNPIDKETFFSTIFEKEPNLVHSDREKFKSLVSLNVIKNILCENEKIQFKYGVDVDITRYSVKNGRSTHNGERGKKAGEEAWKHIETGASLRLLQPQAQFNGIYRLCAHIEEFLECIVGANVYLTPVNHQGFAPHFDDIDAFVCQVTGCKRWKVYEPRNDGLDDLPRGSSIDFTHEEMSDVKVAIDTVLYPGDMLYLPRGTIHEAECVPPKSDDGADSEVTSGNKKENYSLHVTVSMFQKWTWADLLEKSIVTAVRSAAAQDKTLRKTLPLRFGQFAGVQSGEADTKLRDWFHSKVGSMVSRVGKSYPTDAAADTLMKTFMTERLPPITKINDKENEEKSDSTLSLNQRSTVRSVCASAARIVMDGEGATENLPRIVSCVQNLRTRQPVDFEEETSLSCLSNEALAVNHILKAYPKSVKVSDVPLPSKRDRIDLVLALMDMGIVEKVE